MSENENEKFDDVIYFDEADFKKQVDALITWARENLDFEQAIRYFAAQKVACDFLRLQLGRSKEFHQQTLEILSTSNEDHVDTIKRLEISMSENIELSAAIPQVIRAVQNSAKRKASDRGKFAADVLHSKPGGSHDKRKAILAIWATGKYQSRDLCAEEECAAIGLSYSKTRKHLIGTPDNPKPKLA